MSQQSFSEDDGGQSSVPSEEAYETKVVQLRDAGKGFNYDYMLVMIDNRSGGHGILNTSGYRSKHLVANLIQPKYWDGSNDPHMPPCNSEIGKEFLTSLADGDIQWEDIEDDTIYSWYDIERLKDGEEQETDES